MSMSQLLGIGCLLALVHAALPSHWMPLAALGRALGWSRRKTGLVALGVGAAHIISTIALGLAVGALGVVALERYEEPAHIAGTALLIVAGLALIAADLRRKPETDGG